MGHLAVPQADVVLGGGDFNGGVIAHNVDAITCGTEGHMWPFLAGAGTEAVQIKGRKTVDAHTPGENEIFSFQADLKMKNDAGEYIPVGEPMVVTSDSAGEFVFGYPEDTLKPGEYQIIVTEKEEPDAPYRFDTTRYVGTFTIAVIVEGEARPPVQVEWLKYDSIEDTTGEPYHEPYLWFHNKRKPPASTVLLPETGGAGTAGVQAAGMFLLGTGIMLQSRIRYEQQYKERRKAEKK